MVLGLEDAVPLNQVPNHVPGPPHLNTVRGWISRGVRGVVLNSYLVGHKRMVRLSDLERFLLEINNGKAAA